MTTVTLPSNPTPPGAPGSPPWLPLPGRYTVAPGRSLVELTALCGPLPLRRRRLTLTVASLTVPETDEHPTFRFEFDDAHLKGALSLDHV
ncbi:hypothetical protein J7E95_28400, partial [Streptomyces sp. ISL-14]|nr:hypothetical protein [Streptomyces sp. ISL-14]